MDWIKIADSKKQNQRRWVELRDKTDGRLVYKGDIDVVTQKLTDLGGFGDKYVIVPAGWAMKL
jgi:hypothetical protein